MNCDHQEWVYPPAYEDDWSGEIIQSEPFRRSVQDDISIGSFRCRRCSEIGYYTDNWKSYFENDPKLDPDFKAQMAKDLHDTGGIKS